MTRLERESLWDMKAVKKGYKVYDLKSEKIVLSRSVIFSEDKSWNWERNQTNTLPIPLNLEGDEVDGDNNEEQTDAT